MCMFTQRVVRGLRVKTYDALLKGQPSVIHFEVPTKRKKKRLSHSIPPGGSRDSI
jgi:hypothetical protein